MTFQNRFISILLFVLTVSCKNEIKTEKGISDEDLIFMTKIGLLDNKEKIILFDSQEGLIGSQKSGNFISNKRIASYWIDKDRENKTSINYALYGEIDSIKFKDLSNALTYASYLEIFKSDGSRFKVYVDADSVNTWKFFC